VYVSPEGKGAWASTYDAVPAGARFVEVHFDHGRAGPLYMMEKRDAGFDAARGDWRYVVVDTTGFVVQDGPLEACAGCHGEAPRDHLFRVDD
jgi:hypothetical protein